MKIIYYEGDADTTNVEEALETDCETVVVFSDDSEGFCLAMYHTKAYNEKETSTSAL